MTPLRIAHVLPSFQIGGQERVALDLARMHRAAGHEVTAYALEGGPEGALAAAFRAADVEAITVAKGRGVRPELILRLAARFARRGVDVVHTHNPLPLTYGAPAGRLAGAAVVHTKHGENLEVHSRRVALRRVLSVCADAFVAVSEMTAEAARATRDVSERKLRVIPNGIDVARFGPDPAVRRAVRAELHVPEDAWVVGTVGRLASEKNQVLLVRALGPVLGERARLVVVGDGPEEPALRRAIAEVRAERWVHLTGARADVARQLRGFDVFALPSLTEGLPLVVLEAMATALPVVASNVGGLPGVVAHGTTGLLVPPGDADALRSALVTLAADPARARELGACGRTIAASRHSLERVSDAYLDLYLDLLRRKEKRAGASARSAPAAGEEP
jgi:glycosyltransferase involved in cell wall biosynthesis